MNRSRILVVGAGSIGERHARCFQRTKRAEVAICEPREEIRRRVSEEYHLAAAYEQLDDAIEYPFAAAVLCVPAHLHIPFAMRFVERGIPLLIEKPLSNSDEGVDALIRASKSRGVPVSVAYVHRANPALQAMKTAIDSGRFGDIVQVTVQSGQHFPFYRPAYREIYYRDRAMGGGAIQDALTHWSTRPSGLLAPSLDLSPTPNTVCWTAWTSRTRCIWWPATERVGGSWPAIHSTSTNPRTKPC